ncbi:MAG: bifunctional chorismate mutase/prephenate dehydratase [Ruminococcaceae bacterium]|nr:bifunctional chorismate mutase/prephenate dehydratase [Oscillospiraceae bacterium]
MGINELRQQIDSIDNELVELFRRRMDVSREIAQCKKAEGRKVYDGAREREKLAEIAEKSGEDMREYSTILWSLLMDLSKTYQERLSAEENELGRSIVKAIETTPKEFPQFASVACQGVEGAYSQIACEKLFGVPSIMYFKSFDAVFSAIEQGFCRYGVLPIENSTAGSVNQVYDLMMKHNFHIVRSVRIKIDHSLVAKKGTKKSDIREIVSHEQAINQCAGFIKSLGKVKITVCENTAEAAKMVAESDRCDLAALSSHNCEGLYGLECIEESVQDKGSNFTRFICISKNLEIYPGADKTSIMAVTAHKPGALYKLMSRFYAYGINLTKLESRPLPDRNFEFMFYFDLDKTVYSPQLIRLMGELEESCERFEYLGSYSEVV